MIIKLTFIAFTMNQTQYEMFILYIPFNIPGNF